ncbi:MAG TPA: nucleotide exchange factor GrpE [Clostridia bacterium]|nr:nucleotide exchange factor GrpE [Clostridia bacterium]
MVEEKGVQEDLKQVEQEEVLATGQDEPAVDDAAGEAAGAATAGEMTAREEDTGGQAEPGCPELEQQIREQQEEIESLTNRLARLQADFDNYRRRTRKEMEDLIRFGSERVITALLPVLDNFERALQAAENKPEVSQFATGVEMIYRQLMDILAKEGVTVIPTANQPFDPEKHHAVAQVETTELADNMIVQELQKGYALHGKVIRPSAVSVAKNVAQD